MAHGSGSAFGAHGGGPAAARRNISPNALTNAENENIETMTIIYNNDICLICRSIDVNRTLKSRFCFALDSSLLFDFLI